jgi:hypothetical protein
MRFTAICLLFFATLGPLAAQKKPPTIPVSVYCFQYAPDLDAVQLRTGAKSWLELPLSTANVVGPNNAAVIDGHVTFHREEQGPDGETLHPLVAKARIPAGLKRALVVLTPGKAGAPLPYHALVLPHSTASFPLGSYKFINMTPYPVRGAIGGSVVKLPSGKVNTFKPKGQAGDVMLVRFEYYIDKKWRPMAETRWANRDDRRQIICIYQDPRAGRIDMRSIPDRTHLMRKPD